MSNVLIARCDEFLVAFPTRIVRQVVAGPDLGDPDARCPAWRGHLRWRGRAIPLIDLRERLGAAFAEAPQRAVVTEFERATIAMAVDDVLGLEEADLATAREPLPGLAPVTSSGDTFLMIVDFARLFAPAEQAVLHEAGAATRAGDGAA